MSIYFVSYDLKKDKDYTKLIDEIESFSDHKKVHLSVWLINTSLGMKDLFNQLAACIDSDDSLYVAVKDKGSYGTSDLSTVIDWAGTIHKNN